MGWYGKNFSGRVHINEIRYMREAEKVASGECVKNLVGKKLPNPNRTGLRLGELEDHIFCN